MRFNFLALLLFINMSGFAQMDSSSENERPKIFTFVEQFPEFPGGNKALISNVYEHLQYPQMEKDNHIQGKVIVRFIVNEDGSVSDATVVKKVSPGLDKEAVRVVKLLPPFVPGRQQGKVVRVYYDLPVRFELNDSSKAPYPKGNNIFACTKSY